jgi:hypothetical protein
MRQTRQAVHTIKQSIFLDVYECDQHFHRQTFPIYNSLWIIYIGKCYAITPTITRVTATLILLALANLGDGTQIGLFLFAKVSNESNIATRYHGHFRVQTSPM